MATRPLPRQAVLIVNAHSRTGSDAFAQAKDLLSQAGIDLIDALAIENPDRLEGIVKSAIERAPMVIVGGGDGTLSSAIDHFLGTDTVFALLPLGTANSFARSLGIPLELERAVEVIAHGERRRIDLGCIDGDYFGNSAAIGLSPLIAESVPPPLKKYLGRFGYLIWAIRVALKFRPFRLILDDGKQTQKVWATEARIANGGFFGGVELVDDAELDSGEIVIQAVTGTSLWSLLWSWVRSVLKLGGDQECTTEFRSKSLKLDTRPHMDITIDGEVAARTPVKVSIARAAVEVASPSEAQRLAETGERG